MFYSPPSKKHLSQERAKARKLKKTRWWLDKVNSGLCYYCGEKFGREEMTMDHIVPLAKGGKSTKSNIVAACKECNTAKGSQTPVEQILSTS